MPAGGGNVYFVPPSYTGVGGIAEALKEFAAIREHKKEVKQKEADRQRTQDLQTYQMYRDAGDYQGAANFAATKGLTPSLIEPRLTGTQMVDQAMADMQAGKEVDPALRQMVYYRYAGTIDPALQQAAMQSGVDLTHAQIDLTNTEKAKTQLQNEITQADKASQEKFYHGLDQTVFANNPAMQGTGVYGWNMVKDNRDYQLKRQLTAAQVAALNAQAARDNAEIEANKSGMKAGSPMAQVATDHAKALIGVVRSSNPASPVSATDAFKFSVDPNDASIAPASKAALTAAQETLSAQTQALALKAIAGAKQTPNMEFAQSILALAKTGKAGAEAAMSLLNSKNPDGTTLADQLTTGILTDMFGPDVIKKQKVEKSWWFDSEVTTVDLSKARSPVDVFLGTIAQNSEQTAAPTPEDAQKAIDLAAARGVDLKTVYQELSSAKNLSPFDQAGKDYLESKYGMGQTTAPTEPSSPVHQGGTLREQAQQIVDSADAKRKALRIEWSNAATDAERKDIKQRMADLDKAVNDAKRLIGGGR